MIRIICNSCQKPLSLDEAKLPPKEVSFPCPVCRAKLTVDGRTLGAAAGGAAATESVMQTGPGSAAPEEDHTEGFGAKALIVGNDHPSLRQAAKLIGYLPVHFPTAAQARDYYMQEFPPVVFINPPEMVPPPLVSMQPIISLAPVDRRRAFFILFSDNLRTLDGNAAFLYGVNLVVAPKDLGAFPEIHHEAFSYHERLYATMSSVLKSMQIGAL
ncbi:MAG TPA: hypothetical protein VEZ11_17700 [Thermoanaerobaculia bacterium]|nr:hypothetical protein [Thermoanaerobaculia bacterium]